MKSNKQNNINNNINIPENTETTQPTKQELRNSFVVIRERFRVSDREYLTPNDQLAIDEKELWSRISKKYSYGEPVNIVQYDPKKHRVW